MHLKIYTQVYLQLKKKSTTLQHWTWFGAAVNNNTDLVNTDYQMVV